ncbi:MAG: DHH family phosphoesterase [Candidatus Eisenbacteria bacterium]|nr:DHH family phosphoesterase [Candidatus Eisenbacteria bacterium]
MNQPAKKLKDLLQVLTPADRVLILMKPDPDALSSAWALKRLLSLKVQSCQISHIGEIGRLENQAMVRLLKIRSERFDKIDPQAFTKIAVVDGQPDHFVNLSLPKIHVVIDHHPVVNAFEADFSDVRVKEGATATILTEYLRAARVKIPPSLATALCFGIKTDTNGLTRSATKEDVEAYAFLLQKANLAHLRQIEHERLSRDDLDLLARAISRVQIRRRFLYVFLPGPVPPDSLVILADIFNGVVGTSVAAVASTYRNRVIIILRGKGPRVDVGRIVRGAFGAVGSAGGHPVAARAEILLSKLAQATRVEDPETLGEWIRKQIVQNLSTRKKPSE